MARTLTMIALTGLLLAAAACNSEKKSLEMDPAARSSFNEWAVRSYYKDAIRNAVITQATVFPHHFVTGGATLNELGERDLDILGEHLSLHPAPLNVRRDDAPDALYDARVQAVVEALAARGVAPDRVAIADGLAGGPGSPSQRVVTILRYQNDQAGQSGSGSGGSGSGDGGTTTSSGAAR
jgi:hypothetical protein